MLRRLSLYWFALLLSLSTVQAQTPGLVRPKLVVGVMIDQMRWDYLYRFYDRYGSGGFKRLLNEGFSCENTFIPYAQTVTAAGHTTVYTGTTPAIHGIVGNDWYEKQLGRSMYCTSDETVRTIGGDPKAAPQSPRNLWTNTICDELKLATNFRSKVVGVAIKDRGGILPAGHSADAAYWYDGKSGNWVTSTYYMNELPDWVNRFNSRKVVDSFYRLNWNTLYPIKTYVQSDEDDVKYEGKYSHEKAPVFPHELASLAGKSYGTISATPYGNTMTLAFARQAMEAEKMGADAITDFLAVSLSSPDYIGHQFGPNSIEVEDTYLRLDRDLASFMQYLDAKVGKGQYLLFLTADHAVAHNPNFLAKHKYPTRLLPNSGTGLKKLLKEKYGIENLILDMDNYQIYLNDKAIDSAGLSMTEVKAYIVDHLNKEDGILLAFDNANINAVNLPAEMRERFQNGFNYKRGGDIQIVLKPGNFFGYADGTGSTHGSWYPYDSHIPLLFMGAGVRKGKSNQTRYMTDIAATLAAILRIQMPNGSIGQPITEAIK
ncbi:MAG: alkaline phosphatase PafA [Chitinophagaceae bacterium]